MLDGVTVGLQRRCPQADNKLCLWECISACRECCEFLPSFWTQIFLSCISFFPALKTNSMYLEETKSRYPEVFKHYRFNCACLERSKKEREYTFLYISSAFLLASNFLREPKSLKEGEVSFPKGASPFWEFIYMTVPPTLAKLPISANFLTTRCHALCILF